MEDSRIDRKEATMHTVELLEEALALATQSGVTVRQDWFGGSAAGACEFKGRQWVFLDLALNPREQLEQVLDGLRQLPTAPALPGSPQLRALLKVCKAA